MKWNFRKGGKTENPQDAGIKEFSKHVFESIVREATQNSLDNQYDVDQPVVIEFHFQEINKKIIPGYDDLVNRWSACYTKWKDQTQYETLIQTVIDRIESFNELVPILSIADFNTKGMDFTSNTDIDKTKYGAFSRGNHSFHDYDGSAGSEGQGKAALYAVSALRTMFLHTLSEKGSIYEGLTRFATHEIDGIRYNSDGYYGHLPLRPEYEGEPNDSLPFRRSNQDEFGTTISLIGLWDYDNVEEKMIKSAINNFWLAINDGNLVIKIADTEINKSNIESLIDEYLPERYESNRTKNDPTEHGRAKCYYETWTEKIEETEVYPKSIPVLGDCILKISQHQDYPGKVAFFRKQKMLIVRSSVNSYISKGYCGVFVCEDSDGNKILQKMEGKTHTEWDPNLCLTEDDTRIGEQAICSMNEFVLECWKNYRSKHFPETINLKGLAGLSFGSKGKETNEPATQKNKPTPKPTPPQPRPKPPFVKLGILKKGLKSQKQNGIWQYSLKLQSNESKQITMEMFPATDANRVSKDELLEINSISNGWVFNRNILEGLLDKGETIIEFSLNSTERVGLDFKISSNEI